VLGADFSGRLYPSTGPAIHDRRQAPILECLLRECHPRRRPFTEIAVRHPSRGWIDAGFHEARERVMVATEIQRALHRLEQLIRWSATKAESLPSWDGWTHLGDAPGISRLLVVRRTRATRQIAAEFASQLSSAAERQPARAGL
jgi:hypothetical protein